MSVANLLALRRGALAGARELSLSGCGLAEFPREVFGLADTLEVLDLGHNALSALPDDLGRLRRLRLLFCSNNRFERLPPALGDCAALTQIGCRGSGVQEVPAEALPPGLRWLTLTDNRIESLPTAIGHRPALRKLLLSGNRLRRLPESLAGAPELELLRLAANQLDTLPPWLAEHPRLAWLAWAGNPFDGSGAPAAEGVPWRALQLGPVLGEGASGLVHRVLWQPDAATAPRPVALKLFKGAVTSDGLPEREMMACLAAGDHPHLTGALGRLEDHPDGGQGLLMPLLPEHWRVLAGPPSRESCTRDVYDPALCLTGQAALRLLCGIAAAVVHLHGRGLMHGDLYAHNILWDGSAGEAVLSDFGAACFLPSGAEGAVPERIEVRAFGVLLGEILDHVIHEGGLPTLRTLQAECEQPRLAARPSMAEVLRTLEAAVG